MNVNRIVGRHALTLKVIKEKEAITQIFAYDLIREIRLDREKKEVIVLMHNDDEYHRVYQIEANEHFTEEKAMEMVLRFYEGFTQAAMKLDKEEIENLKKQREQQNAKFKEELAKKKEDKIE